MENKISVCIVIKDEEKLIRRCLESIKDIAAEIIVVHDGECHDNSLEIAKEYAAKIFIQPFNGSAEKHRPFSYKCANFNWILQIDADEYISSDSGVKILEAIKNPNIDAYEIRWPFHYKENYIKGPFYSSAKLALARKDKMYFLGITNGVIDTYGTKKLDLDIILDHKPNYNNYTYSKLFKKWFKWSDIQAREILDLENLQRFNMDDFDNNPIVKHFKRIRNRPFRCIIKSFIIKDFLNKILSEGILFSSFANWKILSLIYINNLYLAYRINYYKSRNNVKK